MPHEGLEPDLDPKPLGSPRTVAGSLLLFYPTFKLLERII